MANASVVRYFDDPTQVAFYDAENKIYNGGIAYGDTIICLCCGATVDIEDYLNEMEENYPEIQFPIVPMYWVNISDECLGDAKIDPSIGLIFN